MRRLGILTGLAAEARLIHTGAVYTGPQTAPPLVACAGADRVRARDAVAGLIADGATALMSFGLAGGLAGTPNSELLAPGALVIADHVAHPGGRRFAADPLWRNAIMARLQRANLPARHGIIAGVEAVVTDPETKAALGATTGAIAADMESAAVAVAAHTADLPFVALRAIADPAGQTLPSVVAGAVAPDGATRVMPVIMALLGAPWQAPQLWRLAGQARRGYAALRGAARLPDLFTPPL